MAKNFEAYSFKLHVDEDAELIEWLKDKPKTYFIKQALQILKEAEGKVFNEVKEKAAIEQNDKRNKATADEIPF